MTKLLKVVLLCAALPMMAQTMGLGLSLRENENTIFVPIQVKASLLLEPYVGHIRTSSEIDVGRFGGPRSIKQRGFLVGVGTFWCRPLGSQGRTYLGGRFGYARNTWSFVSPTDRFEERTHGLELTPMLGYSHAITPQLALGLEIGYRYNRMTQNVDEQGSTGGSSGSFSTDQTVTALVARYFF